MRKIDWMMTVLLTPSMLLVVPPTLADSGANAEVVRGINRWPDFEGGIWLPNRGPRGAGGSPPYVPSVAARLATLGPIAPETLGNASCEPTGGPFERVGEFFYSRKIIFIMLDEDYLSVRQIHMDMAEHGDPDPTYYGHSIGHWEGDTLVVDTVAFLPQVDIAAKVPGEGATHAVERFRLIGPDTLQQTVTLTNPEVLRAPWTTSTTYKLNRKQHVQEAFCVQNNRDQPDSQGQPHLDLTPPRN